jgi:glycosyltransferase involved in cell wall biosynthesis
MMMTPPSPVLDPRGIAQATPTPGRRISIALCTYNGERFLRDQLDSFLAQTRLPDELVACDDQSTDDSVAILEEFAPKASFPVRIVRNEGRLGSTKNFEKAIGLCTGDLIATSDQDDVWVPEKLALSEAAFDIEPRRGLIYTDADVVDEDLHPVGHKMWDAIQVGFGAQRRVRRGGAFEVLLRQWLVTGATMMFRSEYRPFILPIPENWIHDGWIAFIIGALAPIGCVEQSTVKYRQHSAQQIGGKKLTLRELYEKAREVGPPHFRLAYERFVLAQERLRSFAPRVRDPRFLGLVEEKVEHQRRRLAIAEAPSRWKRILLSLDELRRGGYSRYSPRTSHLIKDMFF